nr:unnamed protein product [Callosobruchus chinensis]
MCQMFHVSTQELSNKFHVRLKRKNYVTSTSYLEMINTFKTLLTKKRDATLKCKERYEVALEKLELAGAEVLVMQENLSKLQPQLTVLSAAVEEKMKMVLEQSAKASEIEQVIMKLKSKTVKSTSTLILCSKEKGGAVAIIIGVRSGFPHPIKQGIVRRFGEETSELHKIKVLEIEAATKATRMTKRVRFIKENDEVDVEASLFTSRIKPARLHNSRKS